MYTTVFQISQAISEGNDVNRVEFELTNQKSATDSSAYTKSLSIFQRPHAYSLYTISMNFIVDLNNELLI